MRGAGEENVCASGCPFQTRPRWRCAVLCYVAEFTVYCGTCAELSRLDLHALGVVKTHLSLGVDVPKTAHDLRMNTEGNTNAFANPVHQVITRHELIQEIRDGADTERAYVLFWGHKGTASVRYFSQWFPACFNVDGNSYKSAEQFMMAEKARLFGDSEVLQQIMEAETPREAKKLGRRIRGFTEGVWRRYRTDIVVNGNLAKFKQNEEMLTALMGTGTSVIVEASPSDTIWGIGLAAKHPSAKDPAAWKGDNLLGFCLMRVRDLIANE